MTVSFLSCTIAVFLFYRQKLRIPLRVLSEASNRISENDLAFEIAYENKDEMGQLCKDFEKMRKELINNKKKIWSMIEDERTLRSAIAHDIRTPITLIKVNLEIVDEFFPLHKLSDEKMAESIKDMIQNAIDEYNRSNVMPVPLAVSIGYILTPVNDRKSDIDDYIRQADSMMYQIKQRRKKEQKVIHI